MRKIAFSMVLVVITVVAGVNLSPARSATRAVSLPDGLPDGTAVAIIDFQKIAGSSLWATINAQDKLKVEIDKAHSEMADLGVRLSDIHTVALVFPGPGLNNPTLALAGGFEQNDLLARLRASGKVKLTSEKYKDIDIYEARPIAVAVGSREASGANGAGASKASATRDRTSFVFFDANTVVTGSLDAVRNTIDVKTGARNGLAQNSKLTEALAQNPAAAVRFAVALSPAMTSGLKSSDLPVDFSSLTMIFGTIDVGSGIDLNATLRNDSAEHAKTMSEKLSALLTMASGFLGSMSDPKMAPIAEALKTVSITNTDADVRITGNLPMSLLSTLLSSAIK